MKVLPPTALFFAVLLVGCEHCRGNDDRVSSSIRARRRVKKVPDELLDAKHGVKMGIKNSKCDDAKNNLDVDWDQNPVNYTCYTPKKRLPLKKIPPLQECADIPSNFMPQHFCMDTKLTYDSPFPTHASHRPLWAKFGEYSFVPPQRWAHNIEHGSVVMLYHPCTQPNRVQKLKDIVKSCIRKHVIAASNLVPQERPLVLIVWGCRLFMSFVNEQLVVDFIKKRALHGPEGTYAKDGQYTEMLIEQAKVPLGSTINDDNLCPNKKSKTSIF